jgi:hypothetical protein
MAATDSSGNYQFNGVPVGTYTIIPSQAGGAFAPASQVVRITGYSIGGINFFGQTPPPGNDPDLSDIIPVAAPKPFSIVGTGGSRQLQYTHDTYDGGSGPLEILPVYNPVSGNYQGFQQIYAFQSGTWTLVQSIPVAGAFIFDPAHGHFHFPFASYGLYAAKPDGSIGAAVALSTKNEFCISDSFIYDPSLPNAGTFVGTQGPCTDPTSLRGLSIGAVDEYDQTDEGQSISIGTLPDGNYWLRALVDPEGYFTESDKTNNETDVKIAISGTNVTVLQTVKPVLSPSPITLTSPQAGVLSSTVQLTASTPVVGGSGVQFLLDGLPFGSVVPNPPYTLSWDTTTVPNGIHWLAAQTTDATGHTGTSPVVLVTTSNNTSIPPIVQLQSPAAGSIVNAVITLSATATGLSSSVQFSVDGAALGAPVTAPPFTTSWDTETVADGAHVLSASATDQFGLTGNSGPVAITVDNSHPANPIGIDAQLSQDGMDTLTTAPFSTTTNADFLVAFVAYDGPSTPQTATVSGGGLAWQLLKRSNAQLGTSEIWAVKATDFLTSVTVSAQPGTPGYHGSLTVIAFTNAAGSGVVGQASAPSGAPDIYLPGVKAGNWVFAVGEDFDHAIARTPVGGQMLVHQDVDTVAGDTFWVQATATPSAADALVDIHDSAPTQDRWDYAAVEVVATRQ